MTTNQKISRTKRLKKLRRLAINAKISATKRAKNIARKISETKKAKRMMF